MRRCSGAVHWSRREGAHRDKRLNLMVTLVTSVSLLKQSFEKAFNVFNEMPLTPRPRLDPETEGVLIVHYDGAMTMKAF